MSNHCDSPCGHSNVKYDKHRCQLIMTHHAVTYTHLLNMTYLMSKPCDSSCSHTHITSKYDIP